MEPYAYFPYNEESEAVTLFEYIDKKLQGEEIPTFETVADLDIKNIYLSSEFRKYFIPYFESIDDFFTAIEKYPLNSDRTHQIDLFLQEIKSLNPNMNPNSWEKNKLFLIGNSESAFYYLFQNLRELYFYIGLQTNISFDECTNYINTIARRDCLDIYKNYLASENIKSLQRKINKNVELHSIIIKIIGYSSIEYLEQRKIIQNLSNIVFDEKDRNRIKQLYLNVLICKNNLITYINKIYYDHGQKEKRKNNKLSKNKQHEENRKRFNKPTGIAVDVNPSQPVCKNCGEHNQIIYDVNLFTPFKHTVSTVCINCLLSIANNLEQTIKNHYSYNHISTQLMVNYQYFSRPIIRCHKCSYLSNSIIEFIGVREINSVPLCKDCVQDIIKKIDQKHRRHHTLKMKMEIKNDGSSNRFNDTFYE